MFQLAGTDVAGGLEMSPMVPAEVPSSWMVGMDDVDATYRTALKAGGREMMAPTALPGGHLAIIGDPHGAVVGLRMPSRGRP